MWHVIRMEENRGAYRILVGRPEGKRPLGKPVRRREKNIEINFQEMGWGAGWIGLPQDRNKWNASINTLTKLRVLQNAVNFLTRCATVSFSRS